MMEHQKILSEVKETISQTFKVPLANLTPETNLFEDLDLDSLDAVDMASELGVRMAVTFDNEDFKQLRTIDDVVKIILSKPSGGQSAPF